MEGLVFKFVSIVFLGSGILVLMFCTWCGVKTKIWLEQTGQARGVVVELVRTTAPGRPVVWVPRVSYAKPDGSVDGFVSKTPTNPAAYTLGERVPVRFSLLPDGGAEIDDWNSLWRRTVELAVLGLAFSGFGGFTLWLQLAGPAALSDINTGKLVGCVFTVVGPVLLIAAIVEFSATSAHIAKSRVVEGVVERLEIAYGSGGSFTYLPVVSFQAQDRRIQVSGSYGAYPAAYRIGEVVRVRYRPEFPERADIDGWFYLWSSTLGAASAGVLFSLFGWLALRFLTGEA
jgi:Protein of unknown function (DUF3592)